MSNTETNGEPSQDADPAGLRKALKEQGEVNTTLRTENESLRKEMAFKEAGVPIDGPGKWFRQGYDGEADAATIREQALADGIISPPKDPGTETSTDPDPAPQPTVSAEELMQFENFDMAGGQPEAPPSPEGFQEKLQSSKTYEEATQALRDAGMMEPR